MRSLAEIMAAQGAKSHGYLRKSLPRALAEEARATETSPRHVLITWIVPNAILWTIPALVVGFGLAVALGRVFSVPADIAYPMGFAFCLIGPAIGLAVIGWLTVLQIRGLLDRLVAFSNDQWSTTFNRLTWLGVLMALLGGGIVWRFS